MSPALNGSLALQRFKGSNAVEIYNAIMFNFYLGLPNVSFKATVYHGHSQLVWKICI